MTTPSEILGYEDRRLACEQFVDRDYIDRFALKPCPLLDVGCGDGFWADIFARRGFTVHGIDVDRRAIDAARRRAGLTAADGGYPPGKMPTFDVQAVGASDLREIELGHPGHRVYMLAFARTLPHFYQPTLDPAIELVEWMLSPLELLPQGRILISVYTDGTGATHDTATHHRHTDLVRAVQTAGGEILATSDALGYFQILAAPTHALDERQAA